MSVFFNPASWTPVVLAWSFLLLLPFSRSAELPMFIMAILGGILIWKHGKAATWQGGAKTFSLLFLCIWLPMALSVPDSLWFEKSLSTTLTYPRIYLAGIYLIWILREELPRQRLLKLSAWLLLFWVVDALVQAVVGYNLLGYAYPERLNGLFGPDNWKLGLSLAMLSPIVWEYVSRHGAKWQLALAWLGTAAVVLLAGNRQGWVVFTLASVVWGSRFAWQAGVSPLRFLVPAGLVIVFALPAGYVLDARFAQRIDKTLAFSSFDYEGLNTASSARLQIWDNAVQVWRDHPVNGIGARAYRHAYADYAPSGDIFIHADGTGPIYAHQVVLEVMSETGTIGLLGLLGVYALLWLAFRCTSSTATLSSVALLGGAAWLWPLNAHTALYSAYWSLLLGWMIAVGSSAQTRD